ncbi:hypothetical protein ACN47E_002946 [Coniothyrium glycines]
MPMLTRDATPLLRQVRNQRHASDNDHIESETVSAYAPKTGNIARDANKEEDDKNLNRPAARKKKSTFIDEVIQREQEDEDIFAEPQASDNELAAPPVPRLRGPKISLPPQPEAPDAELKKPQARLHKGQGTPRDAAVTPIDSNTEGVFEQDEENMASFPGSSANSMTVDWGFDKLLSSQETSKKNKVGYGKNKRSVTQNIHTVTGRPRAKRMIYKPSARNHLSNVDKVMDTPAFEFDDSNDSDVSTKSIIKEDDHDKELKVRVGNIERLKLHENTINVGALNDAEASDVLKTNATSEASSKRQKLALLGQLNDFMEVREPASSQTDNLDELNEYIQQLPNNEEESTRCTLCQESVQLEDYWEFWKGRERTVKNHTAFCVTHRKKSAREEYKRCEYPDIDWGTLYQRIRQDRMALFQILSNQRESHFRNQYKPLALTGKAAAVPSVRKDLPENVQKELDSYALDDQSTYPGYYGPHGRRAITEHIMKVLKNEIKNCKDAVVQASGPAAFVQAVLVPEAAVLLIMADCKVDRERAEEIREQTYEMGMLLHEEIEDELEAQHDTDDEEDSHGQQA